MRIIDAHFVLETLKNGPDTFKRVTGVNICRDGQGRLRYFIENNGDLREITEQEFIKMDQAIENSNPPT
jgi:hypothetical protein